ncbi:MAG: efflux RND transporter periplasmic adaptor subunit [Anaeromyxobacter sp.]|nr:efflux RND transporter periplasmic adaptor subunit [Anaeromyxobacter sp.]MBL0278104.1 efflux RND transporter periplasmic adaptor subunit [Anaeromyxobacter sp.]
MTRPAPLLLALTLLAAGCRREPPAAPPPPAATPAHDERAERGHDEAAEVGGAEAREHAHGHGAGAEPSDLDQPPEALLARSCEHGLKTYQCDECRYEVGVARVPRALLEDGLVKTATAARRRLEAPLPLTGEIRFDERRVTHLAPSTEAMVRAVRVSLGQKVRAGEPLVELESVALGEAQSQYLEARGALELARRSAERSEGLRREQIASEKEWLQARSDHEAAEIRTRAAREKLVRLGLAPGEVEALPSRGGAAGRGTLLLRAPAAGVVLDMHAVPGELVRPDQTILTVGDLSALWLWADLYEDQLGRVVAVERSTLRAGVTVKAFPGEVFPGTVDFVGPTMDEKTRTVKVRIAVQNGAGKLRAGMFAAVKLYLPGDEEALALPRAAVLADEGRSFVFVHSQGDFFMRRPVETGRESVDWIEVTRGLSGGEQVVVEGAFLLKSDVLRSKMGAGCAD